CYARKRDEGVSGSIEIFENALTSGFFKQSADGASNRSRGRNQNTLSDALRSAIRLVKQMDPTASRRYPCTKFRNHSYFDAGCAAFSVPFCLATSSSVG